VTLGCSWVEAMYTQSLQERRVGTKDDIRFSSQPVLIVDSVVGVIFNKNGSRKSLYKIYPGALQVLYLYKIMIG
jgi:hypothetical protein